jgi:predicted DsbA family dithiol-disulfide isomerase
MTTMRVDVVSDVVCPWCFVGKRRLESAATLVPDVTLDVHFRPFQLDGTIPKGGIPRATYLTNKFGSLDRYRQMSERLVDIGTAEGIPFDFEAITVSPNTLDCHRLLRWAEAEGVQAALKERLMRAYFVEGRNLADADTLIALAADAGLEPSVLGDALASDLDVASVEAEIAEAHRIGVTGVPFFIFAGKLALSGAHEPQTIADAIRQAAGMAS